MNPLSSKQAYLDLIKKEFSDRFGRNKSYSQRAFARDLGIPPNHLSELLRGKRGISGLRAERIAKKLFSDPTDSEYFRDLVENCHARSSAERELAGDRVRRRRGKNEYHALPLDAFKAIEDWFHFAILEITKTKNFRPSLAWIAKRFALPEFRVAEAARRLKRLRLLSVEGDRWTLPSDNNTLPADIPSPSLRKAHVQMLQKAIRAIDQQSVAEREFTSLVVAVSPEDIPEFKKKIREFIATSDSELSQKSKKKKSEVYCLGVQFFNLSTGEH